MILTIQRDRVIIFLVIAFFIITGCTKRVTIPPKKPLFIIEQKIPLHLVLIISEDERQATFTFQDGPSKYIFSFGPALCDYLLISMEKLFQDVQEVRKLSEASGSWDRALWFGPVDVNIMKPRGFFTQKAPQTFLKLKYTITDKTNKKLFSSEISCELEGYAFKEPKRLLLAFNESNYASDTVGPMKIQIAGFQVQPGVSFAPPRGPSPETWGPRVISELVEEAIFQMVVEIREAYKKGQLNIEREALRHKTEMLEAERKLLEEQKRLVAELQRLEEEKKKLASLAKGDSTGVRERVKSKAESQPFKKEKQKLAYVPKTTTAARISLRKEPKKILEKNIRKMTLTYGFYDDNLNPVGSFANDFVDNGDGTVTDRATGLMWQKSGSSRAKSWYRGQIYIKRLNKERFAGYSDWRLPTIEEVASLVEREKVNGIRIDPLFDNKQKRCWSSDSTGMSGYKSIGMDRRGGWVVNFVSGEISEATWSSTRYRHVLAMYVFPDNYVKAVRLVKKSAQVKPSGKSSGEQEGRKLVRQKVEKVSLRQKPEKLLERDVRKMVLTHGFYDGDLNWQGSFANDFVDNGDGTITDEATGLMWQKDGSSRSLTIKRATSYIDSLNMRRFAGYSNWRMPTIDELASLIRGNAKSGLYINPLFGTKQKRCWSSDTGAVEDKYMKEVWIVNFAEGRIVQQMLEDVGTWRGEYIQTYYVRGVRSAK